MKHDMKRGEIKDNALKAAVTSELFRTRVEKPKKGKGSYSRKAKFKKSSYESFGKGKAFAKGLVMIRPGIPNFFSFSLLI